MPPSAYSFREYCSVFCICLDLVNIKVLYAHIKRDEVLRNFRDLYAYRCYLVCKHRIFFAVQEKFLSNAKFIGAVLVDTRWRRR
jgi:hypothetical protein